MANVLTTCPFCGSGCNLYLKVEGGRLTGVLPSASHPVSRGKLCLRGWHAHEFVSHPDRLRWPMVKQDGALRRASWEEALSVIAQRLPRGAEVGVVGSARCANEDNFALMKFARCVLGTDNLDFSSRPQRIADLAALAASLGAACATNSSPELAEAEVITLVGAAPVAETTMIASLIYEALGRGAKLIVISPVQTQLADIAEIFLQPRPGSEPLLLCGLLKSVVDQGLMDSSLLDRNWDAYDHFVAALKQFNLDTVAERTGVPGEDITRAVRLIREHCPSGRRVYLGSLWHAHLCFLAERPALGPFPYPALAVTTADRSRVVEALERDRPPVALVAERGMDAPCAVEHPEEREYIGKHYRLLERSGELEIFVRSR